MFSPDPPLVLPAGFFCCARNRVMTGAVHQLQSLETAGWRAQVGVGLRRTAKLLFLKGQGTSL